MATILNQNPSAKAGETNNDILVARQKAAAQLLTLFGGKTADGKEVTGVFHTYGIAVVVGASAENKKFVDDLRKDKSARDLATFASAHGHPKFPPALVAEFLSRPEVEESNDWFAEVYLGGLREIFLLTCSPGKTDGIGLVLSPSRPGIDLLKAALNVFDHLTPEEAKKLGLSKPNEAARQEFPSDFLEMAGFQLEPATLTAAQRLYRWTVKKWEEREEKHQNQAAGRTTAASSATDPAAALPQVTPPRSSAQDLNRFMVETQEARSKSKPAPAPAEPVIPDLSVLTGDKPAPAAPIRTPRASKKTVAAAPVAVPAIAVPPPAPPAEELELPAAAPTAEDKDREIIIMALETSDDHAAKATAFLLRRDKISMATAMEVVTRKGLLNK